jgi:hypothetical protein
VAYHREGHEVYVLQPSNAVLHLQELEVAHGQTEELTRRIAEAEAQAAAASRQLQSCRQELAQLRQAGASGKAAFEVLSALIDLCLLSSKIIRTN